MASGLLGSGALEAATEDTGAVEVREEAGVLVACDTDVTEDAAEEDAKLLLSEAEEELLERSLC